MHVSFGEPAGLGVCAYALLFQGPSSEALHLGHLVPFMFTKYLQVGRTLVCECCECVMCVCSLVHG